MLILYCNINILLIKILVHNVSNIFNDLYEIIMIILYSYVMITYNYEVDRTVSN